MHIEYKGIVWKNDTDIVTASYEVNGKKYYIADYQLFLKVCKRFFPYFESKTWIEKGTYTRNQKDNAPGLVELLEAFDIRRKDIEKGRI